jgi:hypothetical protein
MKKTVLKIGAATVWISLSEFIRNELILKDFWVDHYARMGLVFPSEPVNGIVWGLWSLLFAIVIYIVSIRFPIFETTLLSWFAAFVLMWVVVWNMGVFPAYILWVAVPLSLAEAFVAAIIITGLRSRNLKREKPPG